MKRRLKKLLNSNQILASIAILLFISGIFILWIASFRIPALEDISERKIDQSTKIYDRTGEILLYDMSSDMRRDRVTIENISPYAVAATVAIEDKNFYSHNGFQWTSFLRAVIVNLSTLSFSQGGSTITQQVVKNSILTKDKTPARKLKELILAIKLEKVLTKDEILSLYLNEIPFGGTIYGIAEAAQSFFGKAASELTLAESAYLASLPKAPTFYSPYGPNLSLLEIRKDLVLQEMLANNLISEDEYENALKEKVEFKPKQNTGGIKAPHFVFFVLDFLAKKYGEDAVQNGGYKIITTLDYSLQTEAETISKKYGTINKGKFRAENNGMVAIDPKNGNILMMVGSRDYFDKEIDGNFNVTTGFRQPGSTFKPFIYATMFKKGYTDQTILYDTRIQFAARCAPDNFTTDDICYAPVNYDDRFRGPMTIRNALAQSVNIPAVQGIYLAGVNDSIETAKSMGIESLNDLSRYGLSLVLGGGEVSLLDMTAAYSVFANDGVRNPYNPVLWVEDADGNVVDRYSPFPRQVLPEKISRLITDILSDNAARTPGFGANSALYIPTRPVAVKTGTSNDYRDAWIIGYTPNLTVGAWVGNNDNRPMEKKVSGLVVAPLWHEYMVKILPQIPIETFIPPEPEDLSDLKPILRGDWSTGGVHSILYWVDKNNPRGPTPPDPSNDSQFQNWEYGIRLWATTNNINL
ncbi:MAG: transglycosylase domain-containing protein [bacterium]|nr:transglycosylase domain-containing protein [bacterium]